MDARTMTKDKIEEFQKYLNSEERSKSTIEKYTRDVKKFLQFLPEDKLVSKEQTLEFKNWLIQTYKPSSVNSMLAALNNFLNFAGWIDCKVKLVKTQRQTFYSKERELSKDEYIKLVRAAREDKNERLDLIMETICGTGMRIGELSYITVEAVRLGYARVDCKGKGRIVLLPGKLQKKLLEYCDNKGISYGSVFVTRKGSPVNRSNIWTEMKMLGDKAGVDPEKIFPHNLRHLFARTYYASQKDIAHLADILGHSSIETTRIYTIESSAEHEKQLNRLELIV